MFTSKIIADRFVINDLKEDLIGRGGMGDVYKGQDRKTGEAVAIKALKPDIVASNPDMVARFVREGEALRQLAHPNIVKMLTAVAEEGQHYLIMEYVRGGSLRDLLDRQPQLPLQRIMKIGLELADALARAHHLNIIHRDLKPANVLLAEDGTPRLTDFGIAHVAGSPRLTRPGVVMGTDHYLSPEACNGEKLDARTDIWAFGVMLYEMLAGTAPFTGKTLMEIFTAILSEPTPDLARYRPDVTATLDNLVNRMLVKKREERILSVRIVGAELEAIMQGRDTHGNVMSSQHATPHTPTAATITRYDKASQHKTQSHQIFICYKRHARKDMELATYLYKALSDRGYHPFIDQTMRAGAAWLEEIDQRIKESDFLVALLSKESADSEMVQAEVRRAYDYHKQQGHPQILPVRMAYEGLLPYSIDAFLNPLQYVVWESESDNERVIQDVLTAIDVGLPERLPFPAASAQTEIVVSEDGRNVTGDEEPHSPLPEFDPRLLEELVAPGGTVKLRDTFYIERNADAELKRQAARPGSIITIRASRQTGKSSLLVRGVHHARQQGAKVVNLDLQRIDRDDLANPNAFLRYLASFIIRKLRLNPAEVEKAWQGPLGPQDKLTYLMEDYVLSQAGEPIILAIDEADRLLDTGYHTDFFGLIRSWHNNAAYDELWERLNIIMVISTEPYLLISDITQSPFNVGTKLYLKDFSESQVQELNRRHRSPVNDSHFPQFMRLINGQPYLTRRALYTLVTEQLTWAEFMDVAVTDKGPFSDHLRRQLWLLRNEPSLRAALKQVVRENRCDDEMARFRLLRAGLIKGTGEVCACRCDLYTMYFEDKLK